VGLALLYARNVETYTENVTGRPHSVGFERDKQGGRWHETKESDRAIVLATDGRVGNLANVIQPTRLGLKHSPRLKVQPFAVRPHTSKRTVLSVVRILSRSHSSLEAWIRRLIGRGPACIIFLTT
jgi:hypothetical protein